MYVHVRAQLYVTTEKTVVRISITKYQYTYYWHLHAIIYCCSNVYCGLVVLNDRLNIRYEKIPFPRSRLINIIIKYYYYYIYTPQPPTPHPPPLWL